jgi:hypothetical protein
MAKSQTYFASRDRCPAAIQALKITAMLLWTNDILIGARRIYEAAGFSLVEESPRHSFGHDLVGRMWARTL